MWFHFVIALWACFADNVYLHTLKEVYLSLKKYFFEVCGGEGNKMFEIRNLSLIYYVKRITYLLNSRKRTLMSLLKWLSCFFERKFEGKTSIWILEAEIKTKAAPKGDWLLKNWDVDCCLKQHYLVVKKTAGSIYCNFCSFLRGVLYCWIYWDCPDSFSQLLLLGADLLAFYLHVVLVASSGLLAEGDLWVRLLKDIKKS